MKKKFSNGLAFYRSAIAFLLAAPFIFKDKIVAKIKEETNKSINAKSWFRRFLIFLWSEAFRIFHCGWMS